MVLYTKNPVIILIDNYLIEINNIAINISNLPYAVCNILVTHLKLKQAFFIFGNFFDLELLIKGLFKLPSIIKIFQKVLKIINTLK